MGHCHKAIIVILIGLLLGACAPAASAPALAPTTTQPFTPSPTCMPTATPIPPPVTVERYEFESAFLADKYNRRKVDIFLPPGYAESEARYPVLYAQDGQDMGDVRLKSTLEQLYNEKAIQPLIVVAVHASDDRLKEYGTAGTPDYAGRGNEAGLYTAMLLKEIRPYIESTYRTQIGPANTAVMGWSLGGLMAFDLAWNHPDVFGQVGVFSGSLWWHTDDTDLQSVFGSRIAHDMVRNGEKRDGMRFWFESGLLDEKDDRDGDGVIDSVQDTRELVAELQAKGYTDADIRQLELPQGYHGPGTWANALPHFLVWAFPLR